MTARTRWIVLLVSTPLVAFVVIGSLLGRTLASQGAYEHLRVFEDVVSLVTQNYVEPVDVDKVMTGAMRGLADGLDADSAYLTPAQVKTFEADKTPSAGTTGLELGATTCAWSRRATARPPRSPASAPATTSARSTARRPATCRRSRGCACCAARWARRSP